MLWILTKKIWFPGITPKVKYNKFQVFCHLDIWIGQQMSYFGDNDKNEDVWVKTGIFTYLWENPEKYRDLKYTDCLILSLSRFYDDYINILYNV